MPLWRGLGGECCFLVAGQGMGEGFAVEGTLRVWRGLEADIPSSFEWNRNFGVNAQYRPRYPTACNPDQKCPMVRRADR